jgi:hypothetical protein
MECRSLDIVAVVQGIPDLLVVVLVIGFRGQASEGFVVSFEMLV